MIPFTLEAQTCFLAKGTQEAWCSRTIPLHSLFTGLPASRSWGQGGLQHQAVEIAPVLARREQFSRTHRSRNCWEQLDL